MQSEDVASTVDPMKEKYRCASCYLSGATEYMHSPQKFGIQSRNDVFVQYVSQGSWTRCLACQKKHNIILAPSSSHSMQQSSTSHPVQHTLGAQSVQHGSCKLCSEAAHAYTMEADTHACSACEQTFAEHHWISNIIKMHCGPQGTRLICTECSKNGYTPRDCSRHYCTACDKHWGNLSFDSEDLKESTRSDRSTSMQCKDCKEKLQCGTCIKMHEKTQWSNKQKETI